MKIEKNNSVISSKRYKIQERLIGKNAQKQISNSKIVVLGVGALGSLISELAVRAGIKDILLIDYDIISLSNLHRQFIYDEDDIGKLKVQVLKEKLKKINKKINIKTKIISIDDNNIKEIIDDKTSLIFECSDNLKTKILINNFSIKKKIPSIIGTVAGNEGYAFAVDFRIGDIFSVFPNMNLDENTLTADNCNTLGVTNLMTSMISILQWQIGFNYIISKELDQNVYFYNANTILKLKRKIKIKNITKIQNKNSTKNSIYTLKNIPINFKKLCGKDSFIIYMNNDLNYIKKILNKKFHEKLEKIKDKKTKTNKNYNDSFKKSFRLEKDSFYLDFKEAIKFNEFLITKNNIILNVKDEISLKKSMDYFFNFFKLISNKNNNSKNNLK